LPEITDPNVLVGTSTADDAAVYKINEETALVCTSDFFSPMVDDPHVFGQIAAANALSDVYAMGAKPLFALNMLAYPSGKLPTEHLLSMLQGGAAKSAEAGISIIGGHTVENPELKYGLAVVGTVHPEKIWTNDRAKPGDVLLVTKPLGSGIITTAVRNGKCPPEVAEEVVEVMKELNKNAAEIIVRAGLEVNACTDITGFGLLGHLYEMVESSGREAEISIANVPVIKGTRELLKQGFVPGGTRRNLEYLKDKILWDSSLTEGDKLLLADAQTSGGLLFSMPADSVADAKKLLSTAGILTVQIGEIRAGTAGKIEVTV